MIASSPAVAAPATPTRIGVAHLLMFLSIVLRLTGRMTQALADEMTATLGCSRTEGAVEESATSATDRLMMSWRRLLWQHRLEPHELATVRRRIAEMTEQSAEAARAGAGFVVRDGAAEAA